MISSIDQLSFDKRYTYADYLQWHFQERVELFLGRIVKMSPAPNLRHQRIVGEIFGEIRNFLKTKKCQVFVAPFDVRLPLSSTTKKDDKITTVVQPDIVVVCDETKLDIQGCIGAPDIVVEVLSPGNTNKEMKNKLEIYQLAQIPEYWLADPEHEFIIIYSLNEEGIYIGSRPFTNEDTLESTVLKDLVLDLSEVFI